MNFLNNVHHVIGDNMKFLQQLKNNPDLLSNGTGHTSTTNSSSALDNSQMQALSPMLMMLLMQLLMRFNGGNGLGSALGGNPWTMQITIIPSWGMVTIRPPHSRLVQFPLKATINGSKRIPPINTCKIC